jgi:hypothetical protein
MPKDQGRAGIGLYEGMLSASIGARAKIAGVGNMLTNPVIVGS